MRSAMPVSRIAWPPPPNQQQQKRNMHMKLTKADIKQKRAELVESSRGKEGGYRL